MALDRRQTVKQPAAANPGPTGVTSLEQQRIYAEIRSLWAMVLDLEDRVRWLEKTRSGRPQRK